MSAPVEIRLRATTSPARRAPRPWRSSPRRSRIPVLLCGPLLNPRGRGVRTRSRHGCNSIGPRPIDFTRRAPAARRRGARDLERRARPRSACTARGSACPTRASARPSRSCSQRCSTRGSPSSRTPPSSPGSSISSPLLKMGATILVRNRPRDHDQRHPKRMHGFEHSALPDRLERRPGRARRSPPMGRSLSQAPTSWTCWPTPLRAFRGSAETSASAMAGSSSGARAHAALGRANETGKTCTQVHDRLAAAVRCLRSPQAGGLHRTRPSTRTASATASALNGMGAQIQLTRRCLGGRSVASAGETTCTAP